MAHAANARTVSSAGMSAAAAVCRAAAADGDDCSCSADADAVVGYCMRPGLANPVREAPDMLTAASYISSSPLILGT